MDKCVESVQKWTKKRQKENEPEGISIPPQTPLNRPGKPPSVFLGLSREDWQTCAKNAFSRIHCLSLWERRLSEAKTEKVNRNCQSPLSRLRRQLFQRASQGHSAKGRHLEPSETSTLQGLLCLQQCCTEGIHVGFCIVAREGDADGAVDDGGGQVHGVKHVAAVSLGAGGACRDVDPAGLQAVDDPLRAKTGQGEIDDVRRLLAADENKTVDGGELFPGQIPQVRHVRDLCLCIGVGAGRAEATDAGQILRIGKPARNDYCSFCISLLNIPSVTASFGDMPGLERMSLVP